MATREPRAAAPRSERKILTLAERARLKLPLFDPDDPELDDHDGLADGRARNGRQALRQAPGRRRSDRELTLARDPSYRRREAARKRALRGGAALRWLFVVPGGPTLEVLARTKGEARALCKEALGIPRRGRLPRGVHADFLRTPTAPPCSPNCQRRGLCG